MTALAPVADLGVYRARREGTEPWHRKPEIAKHFSVHLSTVKRWQAAGMPAWRISPRLTLYRISDCEQWLASQK